MFCQFYLTNNTFKVKSSCSPFAELGQRRGVLASGHPTESPSCGCCVRLLQSVWQARDSISASPQQSRSPRSHAWLALRSWPRARRAAPSTLEGGGREIEIHHGPKGAPISAPWRASSLNPPGAVTVRPGWEREPEATEFKVKKVFCESRLTWFRRVGGSRRKTRPTGCRSACRRGPQTACKTTKQPNNHPNAIAQQGHRSARNDGYHRPEQTAAHHGARVSGLARTGEGTPEV